MIDETRLSYLRTLTIFYETLPEHRDDILGSIEWALRGFRITVIRRDR